MTIFEEPHIAQILAAWKPILYAGVMSCGMGYTLQIVGQKGVNPASASLILSLESSISVLAGWLILGQKLTGREILVLPSTSPANAAWSLERLYEKWSVIH